MNPTGSGHYVACHLDKFSNSPVVAEGGDSGGPVIQRETGTSNVNAVATIVGGDAASVYCEKIGNELSRAGAAVVGG
jgi:hypothetical protein